MGKLAEFIPAIIAVATGQWWAVAIFSASIAVSSYQQRRARRKARDAFNAGLEDRLVMTATADAVRSRVYGRVRNVDGILFKATHGTHKEFFTVFVAVAGHNIDGFERVYFDNVIVTSLGAVAAISNGSPAVITSPAHRQPAGAPVVFSTNNALPAGLAFGATYYVISAGLTADEFRVSATPGGAAINTSSAGSGVHHVRFSDTPTLDANGYVQVAPYNRLDNNSATATISIASGSGSVVLPQTPVAGSVGVSITTGVGGQVGSIETTQIPFTLAGSTVTVSGATFPNGFPIDGLGTVTYQHSTGTSYVRVRGYTGAPGQDISNELAALVPTLAVSGQHRFTGIAGLLITFEYTQDAFPSGHIPRVTALIRGVPCYDWRTATMAWTENPAVIAYDWATYQFGGGLGTQEVDIASFTDAANACDVSTTFSTKYIQHAPVDTVAPRYRCGIVAKTDSNAGDVFEEIIAAMVGLHGWQAGKLRVRAGAWRAPVATITEDWISDAESHSIDPSTGVQDTFNILRPQISDAANNYVITPMPEVRSVPYIAADGQELPAEITLSAVTENFRALDICEVMLLEGRQALATSLPCKFHAFALELFDVVEVTLPHYGWTAKDFEVRGTRFSPQGGVVPLLREVSAASYDPATLFTLDDLADNTELPKPWIVDPVQGLAVTSGTSLTSDAQIVTRTLVTWLLHTQAAVLQNGRIEIQYLDMQSAPQTVRWIDQNGDEAVWVDDNGTGVEWVSGVAGVPMLLEWSNNNGDLDWINSGGTLEWYSRPGGPSPLPPGDWQTIYEPGGATSHLIVGLSPGHLYLFRARAINSIGVRSAWSPQISKVIPLQPLMQASGIQANALNEVHLVTVASDTWTTAVSFIQRHELALNSYTNDTGRDVTVSFMLTSSRRVTTPATASALDVLGSLSVLETGHGLPPFGVLSGPPATGVNHIEDMGPSSIRVFNESLAWSMTLADGHSITASSGLFVYQGAYSGVTVETSNLALRLTVIK